MNRLRGEKFMQFNVYIILYNIIQLLLILILNKVKKYKTDGSLSKNGVKLQKRI